MKKIQVRQAHKGFSTEIRAERPMQVAPLIVREYFDADGVRMYITLPGKKPVFADAFDKMFKPAVKMKIKPEHGKKENIDPSSNWIGD